MSDRRLDDLLHGLASRRDVPHAIAALERLDGSFSWSGAAGEAQPGGPPMTPETPYFQASIDKLFTATLVLQLVERGQLALGAPMVEYLPRTLAAGLHRLGGVDHTARITVRHLLAHASGLPDYLEDRPRGGRSLVERLAEEGDRAWALEDMAQMVRGLTPYFAPEGGSPRRIRYSDTNYQLLVAILEAVTGDARDRVFRTRLFEPLAMGQTWLAGGTRAAEPVGEPATLWFGAHPLEIPQAMASFMAIFSTGRDVLRFMRAFARGELFEDPATAGLMQQWHRFGLPLDRAALRAPGWPIEYGLGLMRFALPRYLTPFGRVPAVVGHTGSTGSWLFHCPELGLLLAGTVDQATAGAVPFRFVPRLLRAIAAGGP